ncbi:MAG: hypothetical protein JST08_13160 [Actinobacteria bacterium]|nr:hypothetical protein [Actinomycetota bacterium]
MATGYRQAADFERVGSNVLEHPFCARWATGGLSFEELANYATEYEHAVTAIAGLAARVAAFDPSRADLAAEELRQVSCWRAFSRAVGWGGMRAWTYGEDPLPGTRELARVWAGEGASTLPERLLTLEAIDAVQGAVSEVMLNGLLRHYGFDEGLATEYFRLHAGTTAEPRGEIGEAVNRAYRGLLDGVVELAER